MADLMSDAEANARHRRACARKARTALEAALVAAQSDDWYLVETMVEQVQRQLQEVLWRTVKEPAPCR